MAAQYKTETYHIHNKNGALLEVEKGGYNLALTTHRRPMNFAQIYFSPADFLNGKSMEARDSTSLKDNVSKCQLLGFRSSPPEFAMDKESVTETGCNEAYALLWGWSKP